MNVIKLINCMEFQKARLLRAACPERDCFANARNDKRGICNDNNKGCHCEGEARGNLIHILFLIFLLGTVLCGCDKPENALKIRFDEIDASEEESRFETNQEVLRLSIASMESPRETLNQYQEIFDYVGKKLNSRVEIIQKKTYGETNELLRQREIDAAMVCSGGYVEAHTSFGAELLAAIKPEIDRTNCSFIIVNRGSPANSFEDLKGRTFAFTDPLSNTGRLYPVWLLSREERTPETYFSKFIYTGSHDNSIRAVSDGLVDGAAVNSLIWLHLQDSQPELATSTKVIAASPPFGPPVFIVHPQVNYELKKKLQGILLEIHEDEKGRAMLHKIRLEKFVIPKDSDYDSIREMKKALGYE